MTSITGSVLVGRRALLTAENAEIDSRSPSRARQTVDRAGDRPAPRPGFVGA